MARAGLQYSRFRAVRGRGRGPPRHASMEGLPEGNPIFPCPRFALVARSVRMSGSRGVLPLGRTPGLTKKRAAAQDDATPAPKRFELGMPASGGSSEADWQELQLRRSH